MQSGVRIIVAATLLALGGCTMQPPMEGQSPPPQPGESPETPVQPVSPVTPVRPAPPLTYSDSGTGIPAADSLLKQGLALQARGDYANAANNFERAIRMAPRSPALYLALAKARLALHNYGSAIQMANRALSLLPSEGWGANDARANAWDVIGDARAASGDMHGAGIARQNAAKLR